MKFEVEGTMDLGKEVRKFKKAVEAENERVARERIFSVLGSHHRLVRSKVNIQSVKKAGD